MEGVKEAGGGERDWSPKRRCLRLTSAARHCPGAHRVSTEEESGQEGRADSEAGSHQFLLPRSPGSGC